jgi:hypothetical protein
MPNTLPSLLLSGSIEDTGLALRWNSIMLPDSRRDRTARDDQPGELPGTG